MFGMGRIASKRLVNLLVHNDIDLDAGLRTPLKDLIQSPLLVVKRRPAQEQFWRNPPVRQINNLLGLIERNRDRPEVVQSVDIPLKVVTLANRGKGLEAVRFRNI